MANNTCSHCDQGFSRRDAMLRHKRNKHFTPPPPPPPRWQPNREFKFQHPFTMIVSGPTSSGKSSLVKRILQHNSTKVTPSAERILWLYRRWQPLYDVISETVTPGVEFIQGIPVDIEKDSFFDPDVVNIVVLDDLMSVKDDRITDLFTEGSHHRNLSVIAINQNLYYNKDPTQRRNCQYMILFKNPADKQSIVTLSRQLYPTRSGHFVEQFEKATEKPYSYLLLDMKANTSESQRLKTNIFDDTRQLENNNTATLTDCETEQNEMASCQECGLMIGNIHDMYRNVRKSRPENPSQSFQRDSETPTKRTKLDYDGRLYAEDERAAFEKLMWLARKGNEGLWREKYDKYIEQGSTEQEAEVKADLKIRPIDSAAILEQYASLLMYILQLRGGRTHEQVMDAVSDFISDGYTEKRAVRMAVNKYKHLIEENLDDSDDDSDEDDEDDAYGDELTGDDDTADE